MLAEPRYSSGTRYDPSVLREMAARLEASASITVIIWTVLGVVLGLAGGLVVGLAIQNATIGAIAGAVGGGVAGYLIGEHRALEIRFNAQLALCHVAIEENTRPLRTGVVPATKPAAASDRVAEPPTRVSFGAAVPDVDERARAVNEAAAFVVPTGEWVIDLRAAAPGRYVGLAADDEVWWARAAVGKTINLKHSDAGVWVEVGQGARELVDDRYGWATSTQHPSHVLVLDSHGTPILLLRRL